MNALRFGFITAIICTVLLLNGCQSSVTAHNNAAAQLYQQQINQLPAAEFLPPYTDFYQSYLAADQVRQSAQAWQNFNTQAKQQATSQCQQLPWQQQLPANFWNLAFYRLAIQCFQMHQLTEPLNQFQAYQGYLLKGILATGDGLAADSAYQINTFADAHELIELMGFQTLDYYAELSANGNALHYVIQVFDPDMQIFKAVYFENQRYLHAVEQLPFPFIGLVDGWKTQFLTNFAAQNVSLMLPLAAAAAHDGNIESAEKWYQQAITLDSLQARVSMAELCYQHSLQLSHRQCLDLLLEAADRDYMPAIQFLLFLHSQQRVPSAKSFNQQDLINMINARTGPGQAQLQLSRYLFSQRFGEPQLEAANRWLTAAAAEGNSTAQTFLVLAGLRAETMSEPAAAAELKRLAEQNHIEAGYLYASTLMQQKMTAEQSEQAELYLKKAVKHFHPEAFYLLGYGYSEALLPSAIVLTAAEREQQAIAYYRVAAEHFFPRAMLQLGNWYRRNNQPQTASRWFMLCSRQGNVGCAFNAGVMFDDGEGINADHQTAFNFFKYAAEHSYAPAINRLALLYIFGKGVAADPGKGIQLLQQSAATGNASASYYLGVLYYEGQWVKQDLAKAKQYFEQAGKHPKAQRILENWPSSAATH